MQTGSKMAMATTKSLPTDLSNTTMYTAVPTTILMTTTRSTMITAMLAAGSITTKKNTRSDINDLKDDWDLRYGQTEFVNAHNSVHHYNMDEYDFNQYGNNVASQTDYRKDKNEASSGKGTSPRRTIRIKAFSLLTTPMARQISPPGRQQSQGPLHEVNKGI